MGVDSLSQDDYERLCYIRRSGAYPEKGTEAWREWANIERRGESGANTVRERRCWHEAGHALVGHRLGRRVIKVTSWRAYYDPKDPHVPYEVDDLTAVAGYVAELMKFQRADPGRSEGARVSLRFRKRSKQDTGTTVTPQDCLVYMEETEDRARGILEAYRGALESLVALILKMETVEQERLLITLAGVPNGDPVP